MAFYKNSLFITYLHRGDGTHLRINVPSTCVSEKEGNSILL